MSFKDWWTNENNPSLSQKEYLFGTRHILMLVITIAVLTTLIIIFRKKDFGAKKCLIKILVCILLFFEILSRVVNLIIETNYTLENIFKIIMPMHICSVAVVFIIIGTFLNNKNILNFTAICGILATVAFLLYPAVGINRVYISFTCLYSIISHMTGFITSILLIVFKVAEFKIKEIWKNYVAFIIMFTWGALLDFVILPGSDYMYLKNDPLELSLPYPYYYLYAVILLVYIFSFYVPDFVRTIKNKNK